MIHQSPVVARKHIKETITHRTEEPPGLVGVGATELVGARKTIGGPAPDRVVVSGCSQVHRALVSALFVFQQTSCCQGLRQFQQVDSPR